MVIPDMFGIAGSDIVMSIVGKFVKYFTGISCTAMVIPDMFGIAGSDTVVSVVGQSVKYFTGLATDACDTAREYQLVRI